MDIERTAGRRSTNTVDMKLEKIGGRGELSRAYKARDIENENIVFLKKIRLDVEKSEFAPSSTTA